MTLIAANNYAWSLRELNCLKEVKTVMRKTIPVARRVFGKNDVVTLRMRWVYALALFEDDSATLDDLREAVTTLEDTEPTARRVLGSTHPVVVETGVSLRDARAVLRARSDGDRVKCV